jgi:tetratricopeptide (TPR) repeat protein
MRPRFLAFLSLAAVLLPCCAAAQSYAGQTPAQQQAAMHNTPEWTNIASHLPSLETASAAQLELAGDVLRARRFPQDALEYYRVALERGGDPATLLNKLGVVELELHQYDLAHAMFARVVRLRRHDAQAWNNLGATEFLRGNYPRAISDYKRATAYDGSAAVFYANLGLTYFETNNIRNASQAFVRAMQLDPTVLLRHDDGGMSAHLISTADYPRLCYEFARIAAMGGHPAETRLWLQKAIDAGFDPRDAMRDDPLMRAYLRDPEVQLMLSNAGGMHSRNVASSSPAAGAPQRFN